MLEELLMQEDEVQYSDLDYIQTQWANKINTA